MTNQAKEKASDFGLKQIRKSPLTSLLGLIIVLASAATPLLKDAATWSDSSIGICTGIVLLIAPDTIVSKVKSLIK